MKFILLAATLLIPAAAMAQDAAPAPSQAPPTARAAPPALRKPVPVRAAPVAPKSPDTMVISQIDNIRMVDPATYEIDGKGPAGTPVTVRMNAFVMQDLGRRLGTYGH